MPRKRLTDHKLPTRVYRKGKVFYFVTPEKKWIRLGTDLTAVYRGLATYHAAASQLRLQGIFEKYAAEVIPSKAPKTQHEQLRELGLLMKVFGPCLPDSVRTPDIVRYREGRNAKVSANREIALLSHIYTMAIRWGLATRNPCREAGRNKERPDRRYITDAEFLAVLGRAPLHVQAAMQLAYLTGQRQADVLKLRRQQLMGEGIYFKQAKTGKELVVHWSADLRAAVDLALRMPSVIASIWVIHNRKGQAYTSSGFQSVWQKFMRRCVAEDIVETSFTFRAIRAKARSDGPDKRLLGHSNPDAMARIYQRKPELVEPVK